MTRAEARQLVGLNREGLAHLSGVSSNTVRLVETGHSRVSVKNVQLIAEVLDIPLSEYIAMDPPWKYRETA